MLHIYPFPEEEEKSADFTMTANGQNVPLHTARVSAYPINRRWPGHQRNVNQTELASFASFAMDEPVKITVQISRPFKQVVIRPHSKDIKFTVNGQNIDFVIEKPGYFTVETDGYHKALHIFADPVKNYDVDISSPDVLYFGCGIHNAGLIELHSNQTLFIDEGAIVYGRVFAQDAVNIRILGRGILDNSREQGTVLHEFGQEDMERISKGFAAQNVNRTDAMRFIFCDHLEIDGITIRDSLVYNIRPVCCTDVIIRNFKTIGNWRYNSDGIDMHNCEHVRISDCFLRTYDDSICIKGLDYILDHSMMHYRGRDYSSFRDVIVERCVIWNDWGRALEIGAETFADEITDITFRDCDIVHVHAVACDIQNVDYADVHHILFENIRIETSILQKTILQPPTDENIRFEDDPESALVPQAMVCVSWHHPEYTSCDLSMIGINRDITFRNISITGSRMPASYFSGFDSEHVSGPIHMENISFNGKRLANLSEAMVTTGEFVKDVSIL